MSEEILLEDATDGQAGSAVADEAAGGALLESLLVEEVSIDGMCGVY